jgi:hypothetical protein
MDLLQPERTRDSSSVAQIVKPRQTARLPILPRHHVYLRAVDGDGPRFRSLFLETWRRISLGDRRRILRHWRADDSFAREIRRSPSIVLVATWDEKKHNQSAGTRCLGHGLRFCSADIDEMPDDAVRDLIAHELAHVFQFALGMRYGPEGPWGEQEFVGVDGEKWGDVIDIEDGAAEIMSSWGFDPGSLDQWALSTGRIETHAGIRDIERYLQTHA